MASTPWPPGRLPSRRVRREEPEAGETSVEPYRLTPKLARRVALLSALVIVGFAALFMRLWALQVLAGSQYAARAQANHVRTVRVQAPRGPILDRHGNVLVANEPVTSVELSPSSLPKDYRSRVAEVRALAHVAGISVRHLTKLIVQRRNAGDMLDPIVVRTRATGPMLTYLEERSAQFPGLTLARTYIRRYPHGSLAAQLLGYDGQITQGDLQPGVEREAHRLSLLRHRREQPRAQRHAERVDANLGEPGRSAQVGVEAELGAGLADHVSGRIAVLAERLQLALGDLAVVAE